MFFGIVIGRVVADRKEGNLQARRLLVVRLLDDRLQATTKEMVCVDAVSAATGDMVLTCSSSSARLTGQTKGTCADNAIVAIVERVSSSGKDRYARE